MKKYCNQCGKEFHKKQSCSLARWEKSRYCSKECTNKAKKGVPSWNKGKERSWESPGGFKKGHTPWNKGLKGVTVGYNKGGKMSEENKAKLRGERPHTANDKNHNWGGDDTSYHGIHIWVKRRKGNPTECSECGKIGEKKNGRWTVQWANIDHKYRRNLDDYIALCPLCHKKYDQKIKNTEY